MIDYDKLNNFKASEFDSPDKLLPSLLLEMDSAISYLKHIPVINNKYPLIVAWKTHNLKNYGVRGDYRANEDSTHGQGGASDGHPIFNKKLEGIIENWKLVVACYVQLERFEFKGLGIYPYSSVGLFFHLDTVENWRGIKYRRRWGRTKDNKYVRLEDILLNDIIGKDIKLEFA